MVLVPVLVLAEHGRITEDRANGSTPDCWRSTPAELLLQTTQIYEGTNQIQRVVMAKRLLG